MHVIVTGNPFDGFRLWGPFNNPEEATEWAERFCSGDWWLRLVELPNPLEWR